MHNIHAQFHENLSSGKKTAMDTKNHTCCMVGPQQPVFSLHEGKQDIKLQRAVY